MSKAKITPFQLWFNYICSKKLIYFIGILAMLLTNSMQVFFIRGAGWLVDHLSGKQIPELLTVGDSYSTFVLLFVLLLSGRILMTIGRFLWRITIARQSAHAAGNLKIDIWNSAKGFPLTDYHHRFTKGNLMSVATSDVQECRFLFGFTLVGLVDVLFLGAFCIIALFNLHFWLSVICLAGITFLPPVIKRLGDREAEQHREAQESLSDFNDLSSQVVSTIRLQRLSQTGKIWQRRLFDSADSYRSLRLKAIYTSLQFIPAMGGASVVIYALLFLSGIPFVINGEITVGDFIAIQGLLFMLQAPLMELGFVISDWKKGMESLDRICEVLNNDQESYLGSDGIPISDSDSIVKIEKLDYSIEDRSLFRDFSLELSRGERVGITGTIGTGKSILLSLIGGITRVDSDAVKFMGRPFDEFSNRELRDYIAYVPQRPFLFAESIRDNLLLDREYSDEEIWEALEIADVAVDVKALEHGLDTELGEWGINLSGGQKQRLTLARAIVRKPRLLLLDDCLSAVDTVTEENILKRIDESFKDTTVVWVAHRDSTLKYCDRVVRLSNE